MGLETQLGLEVALGIISGVFLILTVVHLINFFGHRFPKLPSPRGRGMVGKINGVSTGIVEYVDEANTFIDGLNDTNRKANMVAGIGYGSSLIATLIALIVLVYTEF